MLLESSGRLLQEDGGVLLLDGTAAVRFRFYAGGRQRALLPLADITAYELALLLPLLLAGLLGRDGDAAWERLPAAAQRHLGG